MSKFENNFLEFGELLKSMFFLLQNVMHHRIYLQIVYIEKTFSK